MACKTLLGEGFLESPTERVSVQAWYHPRGCMRARYDHIDVVVPRDPCGLLEYYSRGGGSLRAQVTGGRLVIDFTGELGYPCLLDIPLPRGWRGHGLVYVMASRSGTLYVSMMAKP